MPLTPGKLRQLVRSNHPAVEQHLNTVIGIIKSSIINSSTFEAIAEQLKEERMEAVSHKLSEDIRDIQFTEFIFRMILYILEHYLAILLRKISHL